MYKFNKQLKNVIFVTVGVLQRFVMKVVLNSCKELENRWDC